DFAARHVTNCSPQLETVTLQLQEPVQEEAAGLCSGVNEEPRRWLSPQSEPANALTADAVFGKVALGGTFDQIHTGHKLLLTAGLLHCSQELTVGVTDDAMNAGKTLRELIAPCLERVQGVADLVADLDETVAARVAPITDPFGPTADDPSLQLLVVSEETAGGAERVAAERRRRHLPPMQVYTVPLLADTDSAEHEETKLSSSSLRMRRLGAVRRPRLGVSRRAGGPYVIGLTGGAASGKSSVCRRLAALGAHVVDCDRLGHEAYEPGTVAHARLRQLFGEEIVAEDGRIDRRRLGARVFASRPALRQLTDCVWPEIAALAERRLAALPAGQVAVLDAAVLLEAGWDAQLCDEVWVTLVPREEAVRRAVQRDGVTGEQAERRLDAQMSNARRVEAATVVLSTLWEPEYTQRQVERAWSQLMADLGKRQ
ncbi:LOW QUALITY PROTEIN: bifunctional coenzyme A synthase-like, partial [Pollicipes pollicipes]|uniref:LOW QUALITY PROTEIN: bifunctional coenzyme A synthase-like n=1 Tax=Pollicipes pollicipes TaxID=41117 RepID=UPI001884D97E